MDASESIASAKEVIRIEADAVAGLVERIDERFTRAVDMILVAEGRVIVTGMGKAGIVGHKIQATLASTGTPSVWLHPAEAIHGDLGMVLPDDIVLALSNSGETEELVRLAPLVKKIAAKVVSITASDESSLGRLSDAVIEIGEIEEACPLKLAPSASTAAMLAAGDALALTLQKARNFTPQDYAVFHPGGDLGRRLMRIESVMRTDERCPRAHSGTSVHDAMAALNGARAGLISVVDDDDRLQGVFTHGDFARVMSNGQADASLKQAIDEHMVRSPTTVSPESLIAEAMGIFRDKKINALPVVDDTGTLVGLLDVQDIVGLRIES